MVGLSPDGAEFGFMGFGIEEVGSPPLGGPVFFKVSRLLREGRISMKKIGHWVDWISHKCSFAALVGMMGLILLEVGLRGIFGLSTLVAQEFSAYLLIFFVFVCLAHVLKKNRHIKIVLLTSHLSPRSQNIMDIAMYSMTLFLFIYLFYWTVDMTLDAVQIVERAETIAATPLAIPKAFIPFGCLLFVLQLMVAIWEKIRNISSAAVEDHEQVSNGGRERM